MLQVNAQTLKYDNSHHCKTTSSINEMCEESDAFITENQPFKHLLSYVLTGIA